MTLKQSGTVIMQCSCSHEFQQAAHGGRVFNIKGGGKPGDVKRGCCTVCLAEKIIPSSVLAQ